MFAFCSAGLAPLRTPSSPSAIVVAQHSALLAVKSRCRSNALRISGVKRPGTQELPRFMTICMHSDHSGAELSATATLSTNPQVSSVALDDTIIQAPGSDSRQSLTDERAYQGLLELIPSDILRNISKPARYLGNERGALHKDWDSADVKFCLAYPENYEVGMSNTGHIILYSCINAESNLLCDRSYLPGPDMVSALKKLEKPLFAVESKRPLGDFDLLAIPVHYELGATNTLQLMNMANIPVTWKQRDEEEKEYNRKIQLGNPGKSVAYKRLYPLVFAGGQTVTGNPEPFADFFDFFSLGDGEETLPKIGLKLAEELANNPNATREELVLKLAQSVPGVYAPRFYEPDEYGLVRRIRTDVPLRPQRQVCLPQPERALSLVPFIETVHDRLVIEIRRGCTRGCRFCQPGNINRPARDVEPEVVKNAVISGVTESGYREFSLLSLSCSDWLSLPSVGVQIKNELADQNITLSLPSQRVDRFDKNIAAIMANGQRKSGMTFAPEAGSQRMRDVINKGLTNEELLRGVKTAYMEGWQQVKLYFMIGLPGETDEDVLGIPQTIRWLQRECREPGRARLAINVTVSNFTPKPHTPFQWHSVSTSEFLRKQALIKAEIRGQRDVKVNFTDVRLSAMEDFISRGDRRLGQVIYKAWENGSSMDDWWMDLDGTMKAWQAAISASGLEWAYRKTENGEWNVIETPAEDVKGKRGWYEDAKRRELEFSTLTPRTLWKSDESTGQRLQPKESVGAEGFVAQVDVEDRDPLLLSPLDRPLPWDHIDCGLDKGWLRDELMRALSETLTPDCAFTECSYCGVCGDDMGNNVTISPPPIPELLQRGSKPEFVPKQKVRISYSKSGPMSLISNLDLMRFIDRACLRAKIPIGYSNQIHPHPKISNAYALPLGMSSDAELMEFELSETMDVNEFRARLEKQMPHGLHVTGCYEVDVRTKSLASSLRAAEYICCIQVSDVMETCHIDWPAAILKVRALDEYITKRKNKKGEEVGLNIISRLKSIDMAEPEEALPVALHVQHLYELQQSGSLALIKFVGQCDNDGQLSPDMVVTMLSDVIGVPLELRHAHRVRFERDL